MKKEHFCMAKRSWYGISVLVLAGVLLAGQAYANSFTNPFTWGFYQLTDNGNGANLSQQLLVTVYDDSTSPVSITSGNVLFAFTNNTGATLVPDGYDGVASNIAEIYFDDGTILGQAAVHNSIGGFTDFSGGGANPGNLPSGQNVVPPFQATGAFSADVNPGPPAKGINLSADILGLEYSLQDDPNAAPGVKYTLSDVYDAFGDGSLRLGLHIRSIGIPGGSDSYVSTPPNGEIPPPIVGPVPEPATMLLLGTGLVGAAGVLRRRRKSRA